MHQVQFYEGEPFLYRAIADFFAEGDADDDPLLMISRRRTFEAVAGQFASDRIQFVDAEATLAGIMDGDAVNATHCDRLLASLLPETGSRRDRKTISVYGEMVDLLCARGNHASAIFLEERWNVIHAEQSNLRVLCTYGVERFDDTPDSASLRRVCRAHTHIVPAEEFIYPGPSERAVLLHHHARTAMVHVIDDDDSVRRSLARLLSSLRFQVRVFESAEAFLTEAEMRRRGCLLLDLQLLGMTGPELQNRLGAAGWPLPVIAMSGSHDPQLEVEFGSLVVGVPEPQRASRPTSGL